MTDRDGNPLGSWSPELLVEAITRVSTDGIELRTVQLWFQENDKGISAENIFNLAKVFGCGDPDATRQWRVELNAAHRRLVAKRRMKRAEPEKQLLPSPDRSQETGRKPPTDFVRAAASIDFRPRSNLALKTEALFAHQSPMVLPVGIFTGACTLALTSFTLNVHSVVFTEETGHSKQVGFLWAPNWTIIFLAVLPLFVAILIELLRCWKEEWRPKLASFGGPAVSGVSWEHRLTAASLTFWTTFFVTVIVASGYNWAVTHLIPLLSGNIGPWPVNWGRIAIVRPDLISVPTAISFSGLVFLFNGFTAYIFFTGHILLHLMKNDYVDIVQNVESGLSNEARPEIEVIGLSLMHGIFRCTALGVIITILMKIQSSFLQSDTSNIIEWLVNDFQTLSGNQAPSMSKNVLFGITPGFYYSFFSLLAIVGTFANASAKMRSMMARPHISRSRLSTPWILMNGTMALLVVNYFLIGAIPGFSVFLLFSLVLTGYVLSKPVSPLGPRFPMMEGKHEI